MDAAFEKYLDTVDKCLKPLPTSERVDIVKEIKGSILEMESDNLTSEQILERLGKPKDLAKAYLGDLLAKESGFSWNRVLTVCAYYSLVSFSGLFVIPFLGVIAPTFIICGIITPIMGSVKLISYFCELLFNFHIPFTEYIGIGAGGVNIVNPILIFLISLITGVLLYKLGKWSWKLLILYCQKVSKTKSDLSI